MAGIRSKLVTAAAIGAAGIGGAAVANAATSATATSSATPAAGAYGAPQGNPGQGGHTVNGKTETLLTGDVAAKVKAAALKQVAGTVERVETNVDSSAPYEAHITKSDGSQVTVEVSKDYSVASVQAMGGHP